MSAYKTSILNDNFVTLDSVDFCWRLLIGLGCVPGVVALYFRLTIPETPRFTMDIERNVKQATQDINNVLTTGNSYVDPDAVVQRAKAPKASRRDFAAHFSKWSNMKVLIGTAYSWFALDVSYFSCSSMLRHSPKYCPTDCVLWSRPQLIHHPDGHWFRNTTHERYPRRIRESAQYLCRQLDLVRCRPDPWVLGVLPVH